MKRPIMFAVLVACIAATAAAGVGSASPRSTAAGSSITISNEQGRTWSCGFNPFNPSVSFLSVGTVYEPLVFVDTLNNEKTTNYLASAFKWGAGNKSLTFTIRSGVKWTDGTPFTAADVLYTFKLLKAHPALDLNALWSVLKGVSQKGNTITVTFKKSAVPYFYYIADQTPIVAQHVWSKVKDPVNNKDTAPVGTGPYTMSSCSPQVIKYQKNTGYWQKGLPKIDTVYYPAFTSNDPANQELANGQAQWGSQYIPNIDRYYKSKSPDNHYWFPPVVNVDVFINQKNPILSKLPVRQAMAYALDRNRIAKIGEYGYQPAANQTAVITPTFSSWLDKGLANKITYNPAKAKSILDKAGYRMSGGVYHTPDGKPLSFTMINIGGYSDWVASALIAQQELKAVGIQVTPQNLSSTTFDADVYAGHYDLAWEGNEVPGPAPYYELRDLLYSKNSAPIGTNASSNWERYSNPATDKLIDEYGATTDVAKQHAIINKLSAVMVNEIPVIPVTESVDWYQYNTKSIQGWVTSANPYAKPAAYEYPDWGVVLVHLAPKG
jgi:peptide/nickel transport system substrate-binding protein